MKDKKLILPPGGMQNIDVQGTFLRIAEAVGQVKIKDNKGFVDIVGRKDFELRVGAGQPDLNGIEIYNQESYAQTVILHYGYGETATESEKELTDIDQILGTVTTKETQPSAAPAIPDVTFADGETKEFIAANSERAALQIDAPLSLASALRWAGSGVSSSAGGRIYAGGGQITGYLGAVTIHNPAGNGAIVVSGLELEY